MSIKSELTKTASYLRNARSAILGRGGEISPTAGLKDLSDAIFNIPSDAALAYQTDESVAYRKVVPSGVLDFAQVSKVGGMSYKTENLIPFPYLGTRGAGFTSTTNGLTWSINADGSIRVVGTSENAPTFRLWENCKVSLNSPIAICGYIKYGASSERVDLMCRKTTIEGKTNSFLSDSGSLGTNNKLTAEVNDGETFDYVGIYIASGRTVDATIYPMLNYGTKALPYEPYFEGLRHTKTKKIVSDGANLIPFPYRGTMGAGYTTTNNGITFTVLDDGRVIGSGTATGNARFSIVRNFALPKGVFRISGGVTVDGVNSKAYIVVTAGLNGAWVAERTSIGVGKFDLTAYEYDSNDIYLLVLNGTTLNNAIFEPMVSVYQEASLPYKPYKGSPLDTLTVPASVQSIDGYGVGVNADYHNYIEFVDGKALNHKVCETLVFDGVNEKINSVSNSNGFYYAVKVLAKPSTNPYHLINSHFIAQTKQEPRHSYIGGADKTHLIMFNADQSLTTADAWNSWLAAQYAAGNPVTAVYALVEPEVTDISTYFDDTIEVEGGGTLTAVNEYENAVPTTINYIAETAGA